MSVMPGSCSRGLSSMMLRPTTVRILAAEPPRERDLLRIVEGLVAHDEDREAVEQRAQRNDAAIVEPANVDAGQLAGEERMQRPRFERHVR